MYTALRYTVRGPFTRDLFCFTISVRGGRGTTLATIIASKHTFGLNCVRNMLTIQLTFIHHALLFHCRHWLVRSVSIAAGISVTLTSWKFPVPDQLEISVTTLTVDQDKEISMTLTGRPGQGNFHHFKLPWLFSAPFATSHTCAHSPTHSRTLFFPPPMIAIAAFPATGLLSCTSSSAPSTATSSSPTWSMTLPSAPFRDAGHAADQASS